MKEFDARRFARARLDLALAVLLAAVAVQACARNRVHSVAEIYGRGGEESAPLAPVVITAGFLGSILVDRDSGEVIWGRFLAGQQAVFRSDVQRRLALPMTGSESLRDLRDAVEPRGVMGNAQVKVGPRDIWINAYPGLMRGILVGAVSPDLDATTASDRELSSWARAGGADRSESGPMWPVAYDWRRDISEATTRLENAIAAAHDEKLAQGYRGDTARVDVLTHSMGTLLVRYYLRYGTQPLPEDGSNPILDWRGAEKVGRVVLVGPPNAGSMDALLTIAHGGKPSPMLPKTPGVVVGSFVSMYQMMPHAQLSAVRSSRDGAPIDIYDVESWDRLGWGPLDRSGAAQKVLANLMPDLESPEARRAAAKKYVAMCLANASQFHRALDVPASPPVGTTLHLFASDSMDTKDVVIVDPDTGAIVDTLWAPGDGTVTRQSALGDLQLDANPRRRTQSPGHRSTF